MKRFLLAFFFFSLNVEAEFKVIDIGFYSETSHSTAQEDLSEEDSSLPQIPQTEGYSFCTDVRPKIVKERIMEYLYKPYCHQVKLEDLKRIYGLEFKGVEFTHIEPGDFAGLDNLSYLYLSHNNLESISVDAFKGLRQLTHLVISNNLIRRISSGTFRTLSQLEHLNLSHNLLEDTSEEWLEGLVNLRYLNLSHNALTGLVSNFFKPVETLSDLNLSHNELETIVEVLHPLFALIALDLSYNHLRILDVNGLSSMMRLDVSHNQLSTLEWSALTTLVECNISHNRFAHIPWADIDSITYLNIFNYTENPLNSLVIYPDRDTYSAGVGEYWDKCSTIGIDCPYRYAYIFVNGKHYEFMDCTGKDENSECYKLSQEWLNTLNGGSTLFLQLKGHTIKQVRKRNSSQ